MVDSKYLRFIDVSFFKFFKENYFKDLIFASQNVMQKRKALLTGWSLPVTVLWRTSLPEIPVEFYGHSVLKRPLLLDDRVVNCQFVTMFMNYNVFAESYLLEDVNSVVEKMIFLNMERYIKFDFGNLLPDYSQRIEFVLNSSEYTPNIDEDAEKRRFYISMSFKVGLSLPVITDKFYLDKINLFVHSVDMQNLGGV